MKLLVCPLAPRVQHPGGVAVQQAQTSPEVFACDSHAFTSVFVRARAHWRSCAKIGARLSVIRCSGAQTLHAARGGFRRMGNLLRRKAMPRRKSPRDARREHCGKRFTRKGLLERKRHVKCAPTSKATPRKRERARCKHCHRSFHSSNALRVHVATQNPSEYRRSPNSVKARSPLKRASSHGKTEGNREPSKDARRSSSHSGKRGAPLEAQRSRKPNGKQSEVSPVKTPSVAKLEAMIQKSADPDTTRRVGEEVLRRQRLQKDIPKVRR